MVIIGLIRKHKKPVYIYEKESRRPDLTTKSTKRAAEVTGISWRGDSVILLRRGEGISQI